MRRRGEHGRVRARGLASLAGLKPAWLTRAQVMPPASSASVVALLICALVVVSPAGTAADADVEALTESVPLSAAPFAGTPAVGALLRGGPRGSHFCTASVVNSPARDVIVTAAHCVNGFSGNPGSVRFAPGYRDGQAPYGTWAVKAIYTTQDWEAGGNQDDDVAFLTVRGPVQKYTGAEKLPAATETVSGAGGRTGSIVRVIGYPDGQASPVTCQNHISMLSATQMEFDCKGYTDGTSGGPFLTGINALTGTGTIAGVVGGYQQGGYTPDVSYSPIFGANVQALYRSAVGQG